MERKRKMCKCLVCGEEFKRKYQLHYHMSFHTGETVNGCDVCGKTFTTKSSLKTHCRIHTGEKLYVCDLCGMAISDRSAFKNHMLRHKGEKNYICKVCQKGFTTNSNLSVHMKTHTAIKAHICTYCDKGFHFKPALRRHIDRVHSVEKSAICCIFDNDGSLMLQNKVDCKDLPFSCSVCNEGFIEKGLFKDHIFKHEGKKAFLCGICNEEFATDVDFEWHVYHHSGKELHACVICNRKFVERYSLTKHMNVHLKEDSQQSSSYGEKIAVSSFHVGGSCEGKQYYSCGECSEEFEERDQFEQHMKYHDESRPFVCGYCGKRFVRNCNLKVHTKWHKKLQETAVSSDEENLNGEVHPKVHSKDIAHQCGNCGGKFSDGARHVCEIEKPFTCSECSEGFLEVGQLEQHMKYHDKGRPFVCAFCGKRFVRNCNLKVHTIWHLKLIDEEHLNPKLHVNQDLEEAAVVNIDMKNCALKMEPNQHLEDGTFVSSDVVMIKNEVDVKEEVASSSTATEITVKVEIDDDHMDKDVQSFGEEDDYGEGNSFEEEPANCSKSSYEKDPLA